MVAYCRDPAVIGRGSGTAGWWNSKHIICSRPPTARPSISTIAAWHTRHREVQARIESGDTVSADETYCRVTPQFEVPAGPHDWLARTLFVGKGERRGAMSVFDYYAVT